MQNHAKLKLSVSPSRLSTVSNHNQQSATPDEVLASVTYARIISDYLCGHAASVSEAARAIARQTAQSSDSSKCEGFNTQNHQCVEQSHPVAIVLPYLRDTPNAPALARSYLLHDFRVFERDTTGWANYLHDDCTTGRGYYANCSAQVSELFDAVSQAREAVNEAMESIDI